MSQFRIVVCRYGTVITCIRCRSTVVDEASPTEREMEEACEEHSC